MTHPPQPPNPSPTPGSTPAAPPVPGVGLVVIGRNEGDRLRRCLTTAAPYVATTVYVDSGSTDGSAEFARSVASAVVDLDLSTPFTAARARNAGLRRILEVAPDTQFVQFVDGDCELHAAWWPAAAEALRANPKLAIVFGRVRERFADQSMFHRLFDMEWNVPVGPALGCPGNFMTRVRAIRDVDGFDPALIAGEEPEMCFRLRQAGWQIDRIDHEMALHEAGSLDLPRWWRREKRTGYSVAEGARMHGGETREGYRVRLHRSNWAWGLVLPLVAVVAAPFTHELSLAAAAALYAALWTRIAWRRVREHGNTVRQAVLYASFCVLGKIPQMTGQLRYWVGQLTHRPSGIMEYKSATPRSLGQGGA